MTQPKTELVTVPTEVQRTTRLRCFSCNEIGHRQSNCPTRNRRGLLLDASGRDVEIEQEEDLPDLEESCELEADTRNLLMLRRSCLTPRAKEEFPQRKNLFHSRCTINGKVCNFIIDSGSSENVIASDAVKKLDIKEETHPTPYKLAWLHKDNEMFVTCRALVNFSIGDAIRMKFIVI